MIMHEGRNEVDEVPEAATKIKYEIIKNKPQTDHVAESNVGNHVTHGGFIFRDTLAEPKGGTVMSFCLIARYQNVVSFMSGISET